MNRDTKLIALYWFCVENWYGQFNILYSIASLTGYEPSRLGKSKEDQKVCELVSIETREDALKLAEELGFYKFV